ncbi:hypothetical protein [Bosea sp. 117]|uniref:hypothetical protein n=1 Tax=Bosea sp. 117 TaxID=1125973 RepID=UPI0012DD6FB3|nr:hypothetical protein [Bosea sp. 117]
MGVPFAKRAGEVRLGGALLGEWIGASPQHPKSRLQHRAAKRLAELARLASWRARYGVLSDPVGWARVGADALHHLDGIERWRRDASGVRRQLPPGALISDADLADILAEPAMTDRLISAIEAGRLAELVGIEAAEMAADGSLITTLTPRDESRAERLDRCNMRRREKTRLRVAKHRESKQMQRSNSVTLAACNIATECNAPKNNGSVTRKAATLRPDTDVDRVIAALRGGASKVGDIIAASGLRETTVRPWLSRLKRAGLIVSPMRGSYRLADGGADA